MEAQETVFGINSANYASKKIINEQNYTSRAAGANFRPSVMPNPKHMAYEIPEALNRLTPIAIQLSGFEIYHFACYNVGQNDILTID